MRTVYVLESFWNYAPLVRDQRWETVAVCDSLESALCEARKNNFGFLPEQLELFVHDQYRFSLDQRFDSDGRRVKPRLIATFVVKPMEVKAVHDYENCKLCETLVRHGFPDTEQVC